MGNSLSLLSTVLFSDIQQWDVKQFFFSQISSKYMVEELGKHIVHQTEKVRLSDYPDKEFTILGVSNKVGMFDASTEKGKNIKQKYHLVMDNWIAYNPYRINVGSIGIKIPGLLGGYISPAYVVFSCKDSLLPDFLWLMMKSQYFNTLIRDSTTGSVRQTLRFEKLAAIKAPIPSLDEQRRILKIYHDTLADSDAITAKGESISEGLLYDIQSMVSNYPKEIKLETKSPSFLHTISFSDTNRWEVDYILKEGQFEKIFNSFKFKSYSINELQTESLFGLSIKASIEKKDGMIPILRMSNIVNGEIDCNGLKYLPYKCAVTEKEPDKWLLRKGDFLVTRTNGSKDLVGKSAVFHCEDNVYTYASYLIRYRFDTSIVLPEYVNVLFMTPLVRSQIAIMRRQGGGQYNLNSDEIGAIKIPVPSIPEQQAIVEKYNSTKDGANIYYNKAADLKDKALADFERAIFS